MVLPANAPEDINSVMNKYLKEKEQIDKENKKTESIDSKEDLEKLTVEELKNKAKEKSIKGYSTMTKDKLIESLLAP
ncbi:Rho termination factor N-terminal domain-containing protein [Clostridium niameyense]